MPETAGTANGASRTVGGVAVKPGRHREATLYHALAGAGASDGRSLDELREAARRAFAEQGMGALIITHYQRILHYIRPQFVHVMMDGRIVMQGGNELVERLEREGYDPIREEVGARV